MQEPAERTTSAWLACLHTPLPILKSFQTAPLSLFLFFSFQIRLYSFPKVLPRWRSGKESACQCRRRKRRRDLGSIPELGRSPGGWNGHATPVFLLGEVYGQRSLVGLQSMGLQRVKHDWARTHLLTLQRSSACSLLSHVSGFESWVSSAGYECAQFSLKWNFPHFPCLSFHLHSFPPSISSTPSYRLLFNLCSSSFTEFTTESPPSGPALALQILKDI